MGVELHPCPTCGGSGHVGWFRLRPCPRCKVSAPDEPEALVKEGCQAERDLVVARNTIKRLSGERDAALRILAALREPSDTMLNAMSVAAEKANVWVNTAPVTSQELQNRLWIAGMNAAIEVAEKEVRDAKP